MLPSKPYVTIFRHTALTRNTSIAESIAVPSVLKVQLFLILNAYVLAANVELRFVLTSCLRGSARLLASLPRYYATSETAHRLLDNAKRLLPVVALFLCLCPSRTE